jgi:hypothetical protein
MLPTGFRIRGEEEIREEQRDWMDNLKQGGAVGGGARIGRRIQQRAVVELEQGENPVAELEEMSKMSLTLEIR